jgi:hypothetical protein
MPWQWVFTPDETDERAARRQLLTFAEAERRSGHAATWLKLRIRRGLLQTAEYAGRTYVDGASLDQLLQIEPPLNPVDLAIERAELAGDDAAAAKLIAKFYPRPRDPAGDQLPNGGMSERVARNTSDLPDPLQTYLDKLNSEKGGW